MKKGIIIALACTVAVGGYYYSESVAGSNTPEQTESQTQINNEVVSDDNSSEEVNGTEMQEESENPAETVYSENASPEKEERIVPAFTPTKRIQGKFIEVMQRRFDEDDKVECDRFEEIYGFRPSIDGSHLTTKQCADLTIIGADYKTEKFNELLKQMVKAGYADEDIFFGEHVDFISDEYILKYCNLLTMMCNAYNDPNYGIADTDRMRLLDDMQLSVDSLFEYIRQHPDNVPDEVTETKEYVELTYAAEYGYRPFDEPTREQKLALLDR